MVGSHSCVVGVPPPLRSDTALCMRGAATPAVTPATAMPVGAEAIGAFDAVHVFGMLAMQPHVLGVGENTKVVWRVVAWIPVDMMHLLGNGEGPPQESLRDEDVFSNVAVGGTWVSVRANANVASAID